MGAMPKTLPLLEDSSPICCAPLGATPEMVSTDDAIALALRLKALADPKRLQLVSMLLCRPEQEACTCDLAPGLGLSEPTVSHHLKQLFDAGLVTKQRRGMNVHYRLVPESVRAIARVLDVGCC